MIGNDITRDGQKVDWIEGNDIRAHDGQKLGYFSSNDVYDVGGHKLAYIEGDYLHSEGSSAKVSLDKINGSVTGGMLSEIGKCAVFMFIGV